MPNEGWEQRMLDLWATLDDHNGDDFIAHVDGLAAELPDDNAAALFERACARDSTGHPQLAVPLYRDALAIGLTGESRRRANIQLASSLRNLGQVDEAIEILTREADAATDHLDGAVRAVLALALTDAGREREAVGVAVGALALYLPRYNGSMARYAESLLPSPS